jgi:hypothetical protein
VYVHGFEKKDVSNIRPDELEAIRKFAAIYLGYTDADIVQRAEDGAVLKVEKPKGEDNG